MYIGCTFQTFKQIGPENEERNIFNTFARPQGYTQYILMSYTEHKVKLYFVCKKTPRGTFNTVCALSKPKENFFVCAKEQAESLKSHLRSKTIRTN